MKKHVDFYFDYISGFAYLAALEVPEICRRHGASLVLRPVLFAGLLNHWGQLGPAEVPPKAIHALRAGLRYARRRGVPFRSPERHPFRPLTALRATLAAEAGDARARAMSAIFRLGWAEGGDLGDDGAIAAALDRGGLPGAELIERAASPAVKEALAAETREAIGRGVFGVPTMIVEDVLYWGVDQLEPFESHLAGGDPLAGVDLAAFGPKSVGATRRRPPP